MERYALIYKFTQGLYHLFYLKEHTKKDFRKPVFVNVWTA